MSYIKMKGANIIQTINRYSKGLIGESFLQYFSLANFPAYFILYKVLSSEDLKLSVMLALFCILLSPLTTGLSLWGPFLPISSRESLGMYEKLRNLPLPAWQVLACQRVGQCEPTTLDILCRLCREIQGSLISAEEIYHSTIL